MMKIKKLLRSINWLTIIVPFYLSKNNAYFYYMKTKQSKSSKLTEAEKDTLIMEVAAKLPKTSLFPEKVASAKAFLEKAKFPASFAK
jgi:hypothetical protein